MLHAKKLLLAQPGGDLVRYSKSWAFAKRLLPGAGPVPRAGGPLAAGRPGCQRPATADDGRPEGPPEAASGGSAGDQAAPAGAAPQGQGPGGGGGIADRLKKDPGLLGRGRGGLTAPEDRRKTLEILDAAVAAGARAREAAALLGVGLTTVQRWRRQFAGDGDGLDGRKGSHRLVSHRLTVRRRLDRRDRATT